MLGISEKIPEAFLLGRYQSNQSLAATLGHKEIGGLTNCVKIIGGGRPLVSEILDQSDRVGAKLPIFDLFSLVAPQL